MKLFALIIVLSLTRNVDLKNVPRHDCLQKIEAKVVFKGEIRELNWKTKNEVQRYLRNHDIDFLKTGNTEILLDLDNKEEYAILGSGIHHLPELNKVDSVFIKGYRLNCNENKYLIITKLNL